MTDAELVALAKGLNFEFEALQNWLCLHCQECCKWISIQTNLKDIAGQKSFNDFYIETRQLTMTKVKNRGVFLSVPHTCPHLMEGIGCDIYDHRPMSCRTYDGRMDFLMKDICKWNLLGEILKEEDDAESEVQQGNETAEEGPTESCSAMPVDGEQSNLSGAHEK